MSRSILKGHTYLGALVTLIPADVVAAYLAIQGVIPKAQAKWGLTVVAALLLIIMPFYLKKLHKVETTKQIVVTCISFVIWVYALGGPFAYFNIYIPWIASVIMILWTTFAPVLFNGRVENPKG
jgi:hypothetical protein